MDDIFIPTTGSEEFDESYKRFASHAQKYEDFPSFFDGFMREVKVEDEAYLRRHLLKVLFAHYKAKHPFDVLLEKVSNKEQLKNWLKNELEKVEER